MRQKRKRKQKAGPPTAAELSHRRAKRKAYTDYAAQEHAAHLNAMRQRTQSFGSLVHFDFPLGYESKLQNGSYEHKRAQATQSTIAAWDYGAGSRVANPSPALNAHANPNGIVRAAESSTWHKEYTDVWLDLQAQILHSEGELSYTAVADIFNKAERKYSRSRIARRAIADLRSALKVA